MNMEVSLIVPIYNKQKYIYNLISNLVKQDFDSVEFILVNDGSTDKSIDLAFKYINQFNDTRFKIINKKNGGVSSARNLGLRYARGKYIMFMDPDDSCQGNFITKYYEKISNNNTDIEIFNVNIIYPNGQKAPGQRLNSELFQFSYLDAQTLVKNFAMQKLPGYSVSYISKKKLWNDVFFDEKISFQEDSLALLTLVINNYHNIKIHFNKEAYYNYIYYPESASHGISISTYWDAIIADKKIEKLIKDKKLTSLLKYMYGYELTGLSTIIRESLRNSSKCDYLKARRYFIRDYKKAKIDKKLKKKRCIQFILIKLNMKRILLLLYSFA